MIAKQQSLFLRYTPKWAFKQSSRRVLVSIHYTTFALFLILLLPLAFFSEIFKNIVGASTMIIHFICFAWIVGSTNAQAESKDNELDERELVVRNQVYYTAFRIVSLVTPVVFAFLMIFPKKILIQIDFLLLALPLSWFLLNLPTCVLAWTQPDPIAEIE